MFVDIPVFLRAALMRSEELRTDDFVEIVNPPVEPIDVKVDVAAAVREPSHVEFCLPQKAVAQVGGMGSEIVVCGTEGTFHIQPLDNPKAQVALAQARGAYRKGYQDITFPKFERYVADAADMAKIIRGEKNSDFSYAHDLAVQRTLFKSCRLNS